MHATLLRYPVYRHNYKQMLGHCYCKNRFLVMDRATLKSELRKVLLAKWNVHYSEDILLEDVNTSVMKTAYLYNILPQRIGLAWEKAATFYGWKQNTHPKVDLVHEEKKMAVELKTSTHSDSSAARRRKYQQLVQYKTRFPDYEVFYVVINDKTPKIKKVYDDRVNYVSWSAALTLLFGPEYMKVVDVMQEVVNEYLKKSKLSKTQCKEQVSLSILRLLLWLFFCSSLLRRLTIAWRK